MQLTLHSMGRRRMRAAGFTMLEVLIAILILSLGLLGMARLQSFGLAASIGASQRGTAALLAADIADRMRANMVGVSAGNYHGYTSAAVANCLNATGCTPAELAQNDTKEWEVLIDSNLGKGIGIVCKDSSPDDGTGNASLSQAGCDGLGNFYAIKIWWVEDRSTAYIATTCPAGTDWSATYSTCFKRVVVAFQP
jgi:type IV pilus assembly protein PilV